MMDLYDGGDDSERANVSLVKISKIIAMQDDFLWDDVV